MLKLLSVSFVLVVCRVLRLVLVVLKLLMIVVLVSLKVICWGVIVDVLMMLIRVFIFVGFDMLWVDKLNDRLIWFGRCLIFVMVLWNR